MPAKRKVSRYTTPTGPEAEFQPGSRRQVLRNRLGIARKRDMDRAEYAALVRGATALPEADHPDHPIYRRADLPDAQRLAR